MYKMVIVAVLYAINADLGEVELLRQTAEMRAVDRESCQLIMLNLGGVGERLLRANVEKNAAQLFKYRPIYKRSGKLVRSSIACVER